MKRYIPKVLSLLAFLSLSTFAGAQGSMLLKQPTLSDEHIVFEYANDLWIVSREGGNAQRLTSNEGSESSPHFSPDGQMVAFTAQYDGNTDVYVVNADGGSPRRLTWHPGSDVVQGWTPDGQAVVFRSSREGRPTRLNKLYRIGLDEVMPTPLPAPRAAYGEISPNGRKMAYTPITFWDAEWRNYRGGQATPIWIVDMKTLDLVRTPRVNKERHLDPTWVDETVFFLSERDYASNIWAFNTRNEKLEQYTFHKDYDVKSHDAHGDFIVYEQGGYLHLIDTRNKSSQQLEINVKGDFHWARPRWEEVSSQGLANARLSPGGKRAIFEYRGEILTAPKENGDWRNISNSSKSADRYPVWSPDGQQVAWFSDQSGEYQLMISDQKGMKPPRAIALPNPTFYFRPAWSPNGQYIAYTDTDFNMWYVDVATGAARKVDTERFAHPNRTMNPVWSPDSKWIAYARQLDNQFKAIMVYSLEEEKTYQLTNSLADAMSPIWDESGKYLYFLASTDFGLNTGWLDMSSYNMPVTRGLYVIVLNQNDPSPLLPLSDEEEAKTADQEEKKSAKDSVVIDMDDIDQRIIAIDIPERNYVALMEAPADHIFYAESIPNQPGFTINRYSLKDRKSTELLSRVSYGTVSDDRKSLLYQSGSTWGIIKTTAPKANIGDGRLSINMRMKIIPQDEWQQIYREGWRYQRDFLYVDNVHGAPWNDVYTWYKPWVEHVRHRSDLNYIVDILGGEVSVGHSYTSGGDFPDVDNVPIGLLGIDVEIENEVYKIKKIYDGENWNPNLRAPLSGPGITAQEGDYIIAVNGAPLSTEENFYAAFEGMANKRVQLMINETPQEEGARSLTIVPVRSEYQLRTRDWIEANRRKVDELSDGQLAYVYVPNTGNGGYTSFNRYYFSQQHKKGVVIDERNNGGGSAADYMIDVMRRKLYGYFNSKASDRRPWTTPMAGIFGPKVMIINERAGSGGDLLPYMFKEAELGPLVGTRTWGGLVGTWDTPRFIDGGRMVAPRGGFFDANGEWAVEGTGVAPDIEVIQTPAQLAAGKDPQLERAVEEAMKLMETQGVEFKEEPAPPIRYKRPANK